MARGKNPSLFPPLPKKMTPISRRRFLALAASSSLVACGRVPDFSRFTRWGLPIQLYMPGMAEGHKLRLPDFPSPSKETRTDILILGSGVAGLGAAWQLAKSHTEFLLIDGPEFGGNAAEGQLGGQSYPRGAHYLPLPSKESSHVRELLAEMGVIEHGALSDAPHFNEATLVHSPEDRLFISGQWQDGVIPQHGISKEEAQQTERFFALTERLKTSLGTDGKRLFAVPLVLSSTDPSWRALDKQSFADWLTAEQYTAPSLLWYLNYCCRDDYGSDLTHTSAWAGLHYFASRNGHAANASNGAVLTWPNGLYPLIKYMAEKIPVSQRQSGMAYHVSETKDGVEALIFNTKTGQTQRIKAKKVIMAMPLHVAQKLLPLAPYGFLPEHMPEHAPWLISNFLLDGFPAESSTEALAWDNVLYQGKGLGYVVASHQLIRAAKPAQTVFTAYHALSDLTPKAARQWLQHASSDELYELATSDLRHIYGWRWRQSIKSVEITLRGHAMATPSPGFLSNQGLAALRVQNGKVLFAHSDLSGLSIFEEALWWGCRAAKLAQGDSIL